MCTYHFLCALCSLNIQLYDHILSLLFTIETDHTHNHPPYFVYYHVTDDVSRRFTPFSKGRDICQLHATGARNTLVRELYADYFCRVTNESSAVWLTAGQYSINHSYHSSSTAHSPIRTALHQQNVVTIAPNME